MEVGWGGDGPLSGTSHGGGGGGTSHWGCSCTDCAACRVENVLKEFLKKAMTNVSFKQLF